MEPITSRLDQQHTPATREKGANMTPAIIKQGWGFWNTTKYPYKGCFERASVDIPCFIEKRDVLPGKHKVTLRNNETAVVSSDALKEEGIL